jgi:hypothetical protein
MGRYGLRLPLRRAGILVVTLWTVCAALVAQEPPVIRGEWTATAGPARVYRGKWVGQALPGQPNTLHGSWTLSGQGGTAILTGTWSARKAGRLLQGSWSARDQLGRSVSGTWRSATPELTGFNLQQFLEQSLQRTLSGTWRSGRLSGNWWIKGTSVTRTGSKSPAVSR